MWSGRGHGDTECAGAFSEGVCKKTDHYLLNTSMTASIDSTDRGGSVSASVRIDAPKQQQSIMGFVV